MGQGTEGPELHPAPRPLQGPGLSCQPSGWLRPRSCLALPPLPRLKLINGSAIAAAIGCSLISTAHLSLRRTKGAQRRGQLQPCFGGGVEGVGP